MITNVDAQFDAWTLLATDGENRRRKLMQELLGGAAQRQIDVGAGIDPNEAVELRKCAQQSEVVALKRIYEQLTGLRELRTILEEDCRIFISK